MEKTKILVIDDDEKILFAFGELFRLSGYKGIEARDGSSGMEKCRLEAPQLIFLDLLLPDISGMDLLKVIRQDFPEIPVVIITGHGTYEDRNKAHTLGAYEFMSKPLSVNALRTTIKKALVLQN